MNLLATFIDLSFYYKLKKVNNQNQTNNKSLPPILSGSISEKKKHFYEGEGWRQKKMYLRNLVYQSPKFQKEPE